MKRRDVIKMSGAAMAGLAANITGNQAAAQSPGAKKNVLVIGAGIAGLSCAYELVQARPQCDRTRGERAHGRSCAHVP